MDAADEIKGRWKDIAREARRRWPQLTEDDWQVAPGDIEALAARIRDRFGQDRVAVARQLNELIAGVRQNAHSPHQHDETVR
jgi:uncharacterized protein YjbJ (UPF0337 family)